MTSNKLETYRLEILIPDLQRPRERAFARPWSTPSSTLLLPVKKPLLSLPLILVSPLQIFKKILTFSLHPSLFYSIQARTKGEQGWGLAKLLLPSKKIYLDAFSYTPDYKSNYTVSFCPSFKSSVFKRSGAKGIFPMIL